ncbi:hypothetical protein ACTIVE_0238 [Actinomadura verrucosospora]|uniref:Uncharacterized protein n=1 Tax=Actinomadura verrucosospora TaxID=46165 RepID=A0A7D3ZU83_ACTVE|nr:hypothetical protein ACTIVE_0238 [Actinomadura verrucosospora]
MSRSTVLGIWSRAFSGVTRPEPLMPALLTSTSRRPKRSSTRLAASRTEAGVGDVQSDRVHVAA